MPSTVMVLGVSYKHLCAVDLKKEHYIVQGVYTSWRLLWLRVALYTYANEDEDMDE